MTTYDVEPWDDWPICPGCSVRFETPELLDAHYDREPECAAHPARGDA